MLPQCSVLSNYRMLLASCECHHERHAMLSYINSAKGSAASLNTALDAELACGTGEACGAPLSPVSERFTARSSPRLC